MKEISPCVPKLPTDLKSKEVGVRKGLNQLHFKLIFSVSFPLGAPLSYKFLSLI